MLALGRFLQQQAQGDPNDHQYDGAVEQLVQRVSEAVLLQDRREALQELRELLVASPNAKLAFGAVGFSAILHVVRDREDLEMVQLALECLAAAVGAGGDPSNQAVAINAQQLARTPDALSLLLSLLEQGPSGLPDFYARYHTLQVFKGLAAAAPGQLQEAILGAPLGVTRLMGLLGEQEVLRNEALLLLTQLAVGSADLQKIAAFEGAYDRLFGIIREEGVLDGDIVVQDCFQLLAALLRGSPPNQLMFRETGFLSQLPALLRLPEGGLHAELAPQKAANLVAALEVVLALLPAPAAPPGTPLCASQAENRQALLQRGLLDVLVGLALQQGGAPDDAVRAQALLCLAALISGSLLQQDQLAALTVESAASGEPLPLLQAVLQAAVSAKSPAEQAAAERLLEAYCCGNAAGQAVLAGSLMQQPAVPAANSFGGFLLVSLGRQGGLAELAASSRAAAALSHLVAGNAGIRPHLLTLQVQLAAGGAVAGNGSAAAGASSLMVLCTSHLGMLVTQHGRHPASVQAAADLLRLLLLWLHACPPAVTAFLRAVAQSQPFLVDSIRGSNACSGCAASGHPLTRGMLGLLLGLCASYAEDAAGTPSQQQLLGAIDKQIGQQVFLGFLDALLQHAAVRDAASSSSTASIFAEEPSISPAFAAFLASLVAEVRRRVSGVAASLPVPVALPTAVPPLVAAPQLPLVSSPLPTSGAATTAASTPHHWAAASQPQLLADRSPGASPLGMQQPVPTAALPAAAAAAATLNGAARSAPSYASLPAVDSSSRANTPSSPAADSGQARAELQQALAAAEALQRDNQQLRAELAALTERLRLANGAPPSSGPASLAAAADAQADSLRQQLLAAKADAEEARTEAERARADVAASQSAARKLETDLEDLSAAYSTLDAHAGSLQQQVEQLQRDLAAARQQQSMPRAAAAPATPPGSVSEAELELRLAAVRQEAQREADDAMGDLLVCLGQEEAKVARLRERLEAYGVDCDALLADIVAAGEAQAEVEDIT